jgi:hypothetical protein
VTFDPQGDARRCSGHDDGMEDRSAEGVEHLQAAARELLLAARSFLNVVEEVVEDRDRLAGAASGVVELLRDGIAGAMPPSSPLEPWERAAWAGVDDETDVGPDDAAPDDTSDAAPDDDDAAAAAPAAPASRAPERKAPARKAPASKAPARKAPARAAGADGDGPPRRVRRIAVD